MDCLGTLRAGEHCPRDSQGFLNPFGGRVRAAEHAPCGRCQVPEQRHCLMEIVERGAVALSSAVVDWSGWWGTCICST